MPSYQYVAIDAAGEIAHGAMDAPAEAAVVEILRQRGQMPMRVEPSGRTPFLSGLLQMEFGRTKGLRRDELAAVTRELSIMLGAGQDLDRALRFLVEIAPNKRVAAVLEQVRAAVRDGGALANALAQHGGSFGPLYIGLVRAGEASGSLAPTLERLAAMLERQRSLAATVTSAMIYPVLLLLAAVGAVTLLLTEVLPQFVPLFEQNGAALPWSTHLLIEIGNAASQYGIYALLALAFAVLVIRQALRQPTPRMLADRLMLRVPVLGGLVREVLAARFCRTLGTLVGNGVPLIMALDMVRDTLGNRVGVAAVERATASAKSGAGLAGPLGTAAVFPARTIHLLRLGEETAQLGPMALRAAEIHEENTRLGVQRLIALLVPAITVVMGAAVGGIIASLLLAMLSLNDLANG